jgi:superfamily II helicase
MSKLSELEKELAELFKSSLDAEKLFYLGIQIGRELERDSIAEYVSQYFEDRKNSSALQSEKQKIVVNINSLFLSVIRAAVTEEINKNYGWYVSKRDLLGRDVEGLDEEIVKKYHINYRYAEKIDYSDEYNLYFHAVGKLKEVFEEYDLAVQLECRFSNDKGKELIIVSKSTEINVHTAFTNLNSIYSDWELYQLEGFYNAISKLYLLIQSS